MIRIGALFVLFVIGRAQADTLAAGFDQDRLIAVYTEALTFIVPRILDPVPLPVLTVPLEPQAVANSAMPTTATAAVFRPVTPSPV